MSLALCWLAAGIWLSAGRRSRRPGRSAHVTRRRDGAGRLSLTALRWIVVGGFIVAAVVVFGPIPGAVVAALLTPPGVLALNRVHARSARGSAGDGSRVPLLLDLLAAALRGGQPIPTALVAVSPLGGARIEAQLRNVAVLVQLGADPATAWGSLARSPLAPMASTACRSADSGIRLARGFELLADELRDDARATALARANRAGVWALAPLGLCFLPAFACLGVIPVIVGVAHGVLSGVPP